MVQTVQTPSIFKAPVANGKPQASNNQQQAPANNFLSGLAGLGMLGGGNSMMLVLLTLISQLLQQAQGGSTQGNDGQTTSSNGNPQTNGGDNAGRPGNKGGQAPGNGGTQVHANRPGNHGGNNGGQISGNDGGRPHAARPHNCPAPAPANNAPVALNDKATTPVNSPVSLDVLGNDTDANGDTLSVISFTNPVNGTVTQNGNNLVYTPNADFVGTDAFTYSISDGKGGVSSATAGITVTKPIPQIKADIQGADTITEGGWNAKTANGRSELKGTDSKRGLDVAIKPTNSGKGDAYSVTLDSPVKEDTLITVKINDGTANNAKKGTPTFGDLTYTDSKHASRQKHVPNKVSDLKSDFSVYDSAGKAVTGDSIQVLVKAGETKSEDFYIQAWTEAGRYSTRTQEGNEAFSLSVMDSNNIAGDDHKVTIRDKHVMTASPVALDLNGDNKISTTGESTAKHRIAGSEVGETVQFDIDGDGSLDNIEWMQGNGDGLLVDTSKIDGNFINGNALFGDQGGQFNNGYEKMALEDDNNDGKLAGSELDNLAVWVDDGDARLEAGELRQLSEFGITELSSQKSDVQNDRGETLMQSSAVANGQFMLTEDVWFGQK